MKSLFRLIFSPVLKPFESGHRDFNYHQSHRTILVVVGLLFLVIAGVSGLAAMGVSQMGAYIPVAIFFLAGSVCVIIGALGNERAVATIWGR